MSLDSLDWQEDNMLAQGLLNPIDTARAKLQEQIGNFLQGRAKLMNMMNNPSLTIQGQANGLYAVQLQLENQLQNQITPIIAKVDAGTWDMSDIVTIGGFTASIIKQISDVSSLERQAGGLPATTLGMDTTTITVGLVLVGLALAGGIFFGKRSTIQV
jgi:hypothetical protein